MLSHISLPTLLGNEAVCRNASFYYLFNYYGKKKRLKHVEAIDGTSKHCMHNSNDLNQFRSEFFKQTQTKERSFKQNSARFSLNKFSFILLCRFINKFISARKYYCKWKQYLFDKLDFLCVHLVSMFTMSDGEQKV